MTFRKLQVLKKLDHWLGPILCWVLAARVASIALEPRSILLIRPGGLGDAALLLPAIHSLRERFPDLNIDVLAEKRNCEIFSLSEDIRDVLSYDKLKELWVVLGRRYDVVIDTEQWHRLSAVMARVIRSPVKIGYGTNERSRLFTQAIPYSHRAYETDSFFDLLHPLGVIPCGDPSSSFVTIQSSAREMARELLGDLLGHTFIVLFPGASIPERRWGAERFRRVAAALKEKGIPSVVVGGVEDVTEGAAIVAGNEGLNLAGRTSIAETAAIIENGSVLLSGDSGILHVGVVLGKPTVSLFGPGISEKWAPRGESHIVINKNLACSPCTRFGTTPECRREGRCLQQIAPAEVVVAILGVLKTIRVER